MEIGPENSAPLVTLPGCGKLLSLPQGWSVQSAQEPVHLLDPDGDLNLILSVCPMGLGPRHAAAAAWAQFLPDFDYPVLQEAEAPAKSGWDKVFQVAYNLPADLGKSAVAIVSQLKDQAFVALILCNKGALSRRMAQVAYILEEWKPEGLAAMNLADHQPQTWTETHGNQLEDFIRDGMDRMKVPGLSIAIVQGGEIVYSNGFGFTAVGSVDRVTPSTRFMIGSATKSLTTLMMAGLIDQGYFSWSTPVRELLPSFRLGDSNLTAKLEMRHTVSASTGMPQRDLDFVFKFKGISPEQRLEEMGDMFPTTGLGETFQYSNLMVAAGGYAAARSFQQDGTLESAYENALIEFVIAPLGMSHTFISLPKESESDLAVPHARDFDGVPVPIDTGIEGFADSVAPAGAIWSTALDLAGYVLLELRRGRKRNGEQLLSQNLLESRHRGGAKITNTMGYGLGLIHKEEHGIEIIGHGGNTLGFTSDMFFLPRHDLGVVMFANLAASNSFLSLVQEKIFEMLFAIPSKVEANLVTALKAIDGVPKSRKERIKLDAGSTSWIDEYVGEYLNSHLGGLRIGKKDGKYWGWSESWDTELGSEVQESGERFIAFTSPPWSGSLKLQALTSGELLLVAGQEKYSFHRSNQPA